MGAIASQITSLTIVYPTVYSGADQSKHQSSASLAFVRRIHRGPVNFPHKGPVTRKMFPFDDVIMISAIRSMFWVPWYFSSDSHATLPKLFTSQTNDRLDIFCREIRQKYPDRIVTRLPSLKSFQWTVLNGWHSTMAQWKYFGHESDYWRKIHKQ